jgi:3-oxoacyl-[acyl-carrier-protein] synthase-3
MVFGDAASATIVEPGDGAIDFAFSTDGAGRPHLNTPLDYDAGAACSARAGHLHMDGTAVMNFALTQVPVQLLRLLDRCRLGHADVDLAAFHQANAFMLKYLRKITRFTAEQLPIGMEETGNTGPSSIPLLLAGLPAAPDRRLEQVALCGFGVGLSVGAARLSLEGTARFAPVDVREVAMREAA